MDAVFSKVYSTSANIGSGFDSFGICHNAFQLVSKIVKIRDSNSFEIEFLSNLMEVDSVKNSATHSLTLFAKDIQINGIYRLEIDSNIPLGRGVGSSAAASVGSLKALDKLLGLEMENSELIKYAACGEELVSGSPHLDNVSAAVLGGFTFAYDYLKSSVKKIELDHDLEFLTIVPDVYSRNKTKINREILPIEVPLKDTFQDVRYASSLLVGLITNDREMIRYGLDDCIVQETRSAKYPFFKPVRNLCLKRDAIGAVISGAGPSILCFIDERTDKNKLLVDIKDYFSAQNLKCLTVFSKLARGVI
jgi:homoserine kinase